ncbi:MAG: response regulator [Candidatus Methylomirabilales bacterium]
MTPLGAAPGPAEILLVEDNPGDVRLAMEALKGGALPVSVGVVEDGLEAMAYLHQEGKYADAPRPDLILLDLNLPGMNGHEVLGEIKRDQVLKRIPVIILSISVAEEDLLRAYENHANAFISKRVNLEQFRSALRAMELFWLMIVKLPPG